MTSGRIVLSLIGLILGVAVLLVVANAPRSPSAPERGYSAFLDDVAGGRVQRVVQHGQTLTVDENGTTYSVVVPSVVTNVYLDMQYAAEESSRTLPADIYSAEIEPDTSWIGLLLTGLLPLLVIGGFIVLMLRAARRAPQPFSLQARLAQLEEARKAGQLSAEEYETKRAEILRSL
jgi:ATP-dependent Zn protease